MSMSMENLPILPPLTSSSSSSFHSVAQSFTSESPLSTPHPSSTQLGSTHVTSSPFADPPILPSTVSSFGHSVEHVKGSGRTRGISPGGDVFDQKSSNYSRGYAGDHSSGLDPLCTSPRVQGCDVYIGVSSGLKPLMMVRFVKWLRAELEMQGVSCFVADQSRCNRAYDHHIARAAMDAASFGVVVVTRASFSSPHTMEEILFFSKKKNLLPIFFELAQVECTARDIIERRGDVWERCGGMLWKIYGGVEAEWRHAVNAMSRLNLKLEANAGNFRDCVSEAVIILGSGLGRRRVVERVKSWKNLAVEESPFPRNANFVGRDKELLELEFLLFGDVGEEEENENMDNRNRMRHKGAEVPMRTRDANEFGARRRKGKEPMVCEEPAMKIELQGQHVTTERNASIHGRVNRTVKSEGVKGIACVSGDSGIGKTELLLEYAYRFSQRYKMILWVGGESRYLCQNYMKLLPRFGVDTNMINKLSSDTNGSQSLEDIEGEAIRKVRKELARDIPYLLVIDNLEREKDWWDGRHIMELLPCFGGATHVLISTRLPQVIDIEPLRLLYLSSSEGMFLMNGDTNNLDIEESDALRLIEEKLGRLPLGLSIVGAILSEFPIKPSKLLDAVNNMPYRDFKWNTGEDLALKHNPFIGQLLDFCFSLCDQESSNLVIRMVQASHLFAPSPVPTSLLALAAREHLGEHQRTRFWTKYQCVATCMCMASPRSKNSEDEVLTMLVKLRIAKSTTKLDFISFHDIVKLYAYKRGHRGIADSVMRAISLKGSLPEHSEHVWAACFLLFKFDVGQVVTHLSINDLLSFIEKLVLPLAMHSCVTYFRYNSALELLRLATETLEDIETSFLSEFNNNHGNPACLMKSGSTSTLQSNPLIYRKFAHLRATLLETRAKIMLRGGLYDIGEALCRTAVSTKEVIYGWEHPETVCSRETLERLIRLKSSF